MPNRVSENQHYVPQFLLRKFQRGKGKICVFDKHLNKSFETNIKNIAVEKNFNEFEFEGETLTLEPSLCELEGKASKIIGKIINKKALTEISLKEKIVLSHFIIVQHLRTNGQREIIKDLGGKLSRKLTEMGVDPKEIPVDEKMDQLLFLKGILKAHEFVPYLLDKVWVLLETTTKHPYYISDNPITLQNQNDMLPRGNLGFAVEGIEIYLPLTKTLTLALWCSSYKKMMIDGQKQARGVIQRSKMYKKLGINIDGHHGGKGKKIAKDALRASNRMLNAFNKGKPLKSLPENVTNLNSLQILYSERFVMASVDNFELVQDMIRENKANRKGRRVSIA